MKFINELREGEKISGIYLCKHKQPAVTKNGKPYENVILQDKTGTIDAKIWEPNSQGIDDFDTLDYIDVIGDVTSFQGSLQVSIKRARKAHEGEYEPGNYLPISEKSIDGMYEELLKYVHSIKNAYLNKLLVKFFEEDEEFIKTFKGNSAAKTVHHGFIGGLLEHTLGVVRLCQYYSKAYPVLNRDLLITAAMLHDIGKYVNLNDPGKNGYQLIISTEIMGLSHREREEVANIVLYNTQELPDTDELDTAFWREEYLRIAKLSSILRLANALDRGHKQKLEKCSMARKGKELIISLETNQDITLEITRFSKKAETFSEFTGITPVLKQKRAL